MSQLLPFNNLLRPALYADNSRSHGRLGTAYILILLTIGCIFFPLLTSRYYSSHMVEFAMEEPSFESYNSTLKYARAVRCPCQHHDRDPHRLLGLVAPVGISQAIDEATRLQSGCETSAIQSFSRNASSNPPDEALLRDFSVGLCERLFTWEARNSFFSTLSSTVSSHSMLAHTDLLSSVGKYVIAAVLGATRQFRAEYEVGLRRSAILANTTQTVGQHAVEMIRLFTTIHKEAVTNITSTIVIYTWSSITARASPEGLHREFFDQCAPTRCTYIEPEGLVDSAMYAVAVTTPLGIFIFGAASYIYALVVHSRSQNGDLAASVRCTSAKTSQVAPGAADSVVPDDANAIELISTDGDEGSPA
eukprot:TRINITY_DN317_c0_g1_i1.p1 TRINITY_DN317_c0_g1~~TRINITY_DN317_c0_g1_i1.p1  ORF type:complete len:362 (+),score=-27.69 TRINITY_DN317_c0_g1_i1:162-1247(+)